MPKKTVSLSYVAEACHALTIRCVNGTMPPYGIWGIPRGGVSAAYALGNHCPATFHASPDPAAADIIVDDLVDTGETLARYRALYPDKQFAVLFDKGNAPGDWWSYGIREDRDAWLVMPWEASEEKSADDIVTRLLSFIGEDPTRGGLRETPARVLKAWREWSSGYGVKPEEVLKTFEDGAESYDEMVLVKDIPVYSHCEHHLAAIFGVAHIAYIPNGKIVGLSKLSRLVDVFAHRLQVQERMTNQIADALGEHLQPKGVGVVLECRHLCMESRGIRRAGSATITSAMRGALFDKPAARAELLSLIGRRS